MNFLKEIILDMNLEQKKIANAINLTRARVVEICMKDERIRESGERKMIYGFYDKAQSKF